MHAVHLASIRVSGDKSGEVDRKNHLLYFKAMLRVFIGHGHPRKDFMPDSDFFSAYPYSSIAPTGNLGDIYQTEQLDTSTEQAPRLEETIRLAHLLMGSQVGHGQFSNIPNEMPNGNPSREETQTGSDQYSYCSVPLPMFEPERSNPPNGLGSRSTSHSPHRGLGCEEEEPISNSPFQVGDIGSSDPAPGLAHPIPRHAHYMAASFFAPTPFAECKSMSDTASAFDQTGTFQGTAWTSNDLGSPFLLQTRISPDSGSVTNVPDNCAAIEITRYEPIPHSWSAIRHQPRWDIQHNACHHEQHEQHESFWTETRLLSSFDQSHALLNQLHLEEDDINGVPLLAAGDQAYIQPLTLIDPYKSVYPDFTFENDLPAVDIDCNARQQSADVFAYQRSPRLDHTPNSHTGSDRDSPCQPRHMNRSSLSSEDTRNAFLIECKRRGLSYKEIKRIGGFREAESTLRGRFRTLTKSKEQRVRKPQWQEKDIKLLFEAVRACSGSGKQSPCISGCVLRSVIQPPKVSWKKVAQYIWAHGGSYHFGNATCKKKWCEVQSSRVRTV